MCDMRISRGEMSAGSYRQRSHTSLMGTERPDTATGGRADADSWRAGATSVPAREHTAVVEFHGLRSGTASRGPREPRSGHFVRRARALASALLRRHLPRVEEVADPRGATLRIRHGYAGNDVARACRAGTHARTVPSDRHRCSVLSTI